MPLIIAGERMAQLLEKHRSHLSSAEILSILGARDGGEILELHREHRARLLILDTTLPGMTPAEICRCVRADVEMRKVSLIVIGAADAVAEIERCAANRSFVRPLDREDFLGAVRTLVSVAARKDYRVLVSLKLSGQAGGVAFFGRSENISSTGIMFATNHILDTGDRIDLTLVLPGQGQLHTGAEIVRAQGIAGKDPRYGARFVDPGREAHRMIEAFIKRKLL